VSEPPFSPSLPWVHYGLQVITRLTRRAAGAVWYAATHLAFYAGWPSAVTAIGVARDVFKR
jgi:hypothetical protein